jgi:hypothetical protein
MGPLPSLMIATLNGFWAGKRVESLLKHPSSVLTVLRSVETGVIIQQPLDLILEVDDDEEGNAVCCMLK